MTEIAKFAWTLVLVIFFVGMKAFIFLLIIIALIAVLYIINPDWFKPK